MRQTKSGKHVSAATTCGTLLYAATQLQPRESVSVTYRSIPTWVHETIISKSAYRLLVSVDPRFHDGVAKGRDEELQGLSRNKHEKRHSISRVRTGLLFEFSSLFNSNRSSNVELEVSGRRSGRSRRKS